MGFRVQALEQNLQLVLSNVSGPAAAQRLADFAREKLLDAISSGQGSSSFTRYVNGREGASEESVKLPGPILYKFSWLDEVAEFALEFLRARSPLGPAERGHYRDSHQAMVGGRVVASSDDPGSIRSVEIPAGAEIVIVSDKPYARKIEVGAMRMRVPPRVYEDARQSVLRHYRQIVRVDLRFVTRSDGYTLKGGAPKRAAKQNMMSSAFRGGRAFLSTRKGTEAGAAMTYPALILNLRNG